MEAFSNQVLVLGTGYMGKTHAENWGKNPDVNVLAYSQSGKGFRDTGNIKTGGGASLDQVQVLQGDLNLAIAGMPKGSVIDICLPTVLHLAAIQAAAKAGMHTICEKPLARDPKSAGLIADIAAEHPELRMMPAHCLRFWPAYEELIRITQSKELGVLESITFKRQGGMPEWGEHFADGAKSGGALFDLLIHDLDIANLLTGQKGDQEFIASGQKGKSGAWDRLQFLSQSANGPSVIIQGGWKVPNSMPFTMEFEAHFTNATLTLANGQLKLFTNDKATTLNLSDETGWEREVQHFLDCVKDPKLEQRVRMQDAAYAVRLASRIEEKLNQGG